MSYVGDFVTGAVVRFLWNTNAVAGESITRSTDGAIRIYKNNSVTQRTSAAGITDTEDFDSLTGLHLCNIDLADNTDAGFYAAAADYHVVIQGTTIDGKAINAVIAEFSIENRPVASLKAASIVAATFAADAITAAKLAADVTTELQAGLATAAALATVQADTDNIQTRLPAALVSGRMDSDVAVVQVAAAGLIASITLEEPPGNHSGAGMLGKVVTDIKADTTALQGLPADIAGLQGDVGAIYTNLQDNLPLSVARGTAQAGSTSSTIKLAAGASAIDNFYRYCLVAVESGTGLIQTRLITAYDGTTKVATVDLDWAVTPDVTSVYKIHHYSAITEIAVSVLQGDIPTWAGGSNLAQYISDLDNKSNDLLTDVSNVPGLVWDEILSGHVISLSTGEVLQTILDYASDNNIRLVDLPITIWNALLLDHAITGSFGERLNDLPGLIWDELEASHVLAGSFGQSAQLIRGGTCQAGSTSTTVVLDAGANAADDYYNKKIILLETGTGYGQWRRIISYVGATRTATVATWFITPDATTTYAIIGS